MITTITGSKVPTIPASKVISAETLAEPDKPIGQHELVTSQVVTRQVVAQSQPKFNQVRMQQSIVDRGSLNQYIALEVNANSGV